MKSYLPFFVLAFLHLVLLPPYLATAANITVPSSLSTNSNNSSRISSSGDFAFGFRRLNNSNLFLLAVWYNRIPERTIIWNANSDNPAPAGSTLKLTQNGLSLNSPGGKSIWSAQPSRTVSHASMLDTGNFLRSSENSANVWETFKNLTDTILPTQKLDPGSKPHSRIAESNFSRGRFFLQLNPPNKCDSLSCGVNSFCRSENGESICQCPKYFERMDPKKPSSGCRPTYSLAGCEEEVSERRDPKVLYEMNEIRGLNWPEGDYEYLAPQTLTECKISCLNDCMCNAAVYGGTNGCWKKRFPLGNGIPDISATVLFKARKGDSPSPSPSPCDRVNLVGAVLFGCYAFFITIYIIIHVNKNINTNICTMCNCF